MNVHLFFEQLSLRLTLPALRYCILSINFRAFNVQPMAQIKQGMHELLNLCLFREHIPPLHTPTGASLSK